MKTINGKLSVYTTVDKGSIYDIKDLLTFTEHSVELNYVNEGCDLKWDDELETSIKIAKLLNCNKSDLLFLDGWNTGSYLIVNKLTKVYFITDWSQSK